MPFYKQYNETEVINMIGELINKLRTHIGFTQTTLAKRLGLSRSAINAWEMGISIPSTQYLVELSKLFKVSTDYILGLEPYETIDISDLNDTDKKTIYNLVTRFKQHQYAIDLLYKHDEIMYDDDYETLDMISPRTQGTVIPKIPKGKRKSSKNSDK